MALLAAFKSPRNLIDETDLRHYWDMALRVIEQQYEQISSAADTMRMLHALKAYVLTTKAESISNGLSIFTSRMTMY